MGCATSVRALSTTPPDVIVHFKGPTRIVQDDVVDVYVLVQDYPLPKGPFGDGSLGLKLVLVLNTGKGKPTLCERMTLFPILPCKTVESPRLAEYTANNLYRDTGFTANDAAILINDSTNTVLNGVKWLRPKDMVRHPQIGKEVGGLKRGVMSSDAMVSALSVLGQRNDMLRRVIDPDQPLFGANHRGIIQVRLWRFGEWRDVVIDDLLPSKANAALATAARDPAHFWPELIEKAYAKLLGSYGAIKSSRFEDILVDLTGGVVQQIAIGTHDANAAHFVGRNDSELIRSALRRGALIVAHPSAIGVSSEAISERPSSRLTVPQITAAETTTLIEPFQLVAVCSVRSAWGDSTLVCLRGPWGHHVRWTGSWAQGDVRWLGVSDEVRSRLTAVAAAEPSLFWMAWSDLVHYFSHVTVIMLHRPYGESLEIVSVFGRWVAGSSGGGCRNDLEKFATNPQYLLTLTDPDDEEPPVDDPTARCSVIIALMQEHRRTYRETEPRLLPIAVFVYKADTPNERLSAEFFLCVAEEEAQECTLGANGIGPGRRNSERRRSFSERRHCFADRRETVAHLRLPPGHYVLVPATFAPDCEQSFLLRVLTTSGATIQSLPEHSPLHHVRTAGLDQTAPSNGNHRQQSILEVNEEIE